MQIKDDSGTIVALVVVFRSNIKNKMETRLIKMTVEQWLKKWKIEACTLKLVIAEKKST